MKQKLTVDRVLCRFVYEGGIKGEWVSLEEAMKTWLNPASGHAVKWVEFIEKKRERWDTS